MGNFKLRQTGAVIQALLDKVETPDTTPTNNSQELITSGGVYTEMAKRIPGVVITEEAYQEMLEGGTLDANTLYFRLEE